MSKSYSVIPELQLPKVEDSQFGEAMRALDPPKQRFVIAILELGGGPDKFSQCALRAGFDRAAYTQSGWSQLVHRLSHDDRIQKAIEEESKRRLRTASVLAVSKLIEIADNPQTGVRDKLRAIEMILNRTGMPTQTEQKVTVEHKMSDHELVSNVRNLASRLGINPDQLLLPSAAKEPIEGEFMDITPDEEHSAEGLEDIL